MRAGLLAGAWLAAAAVALGACVIDPATGERSLGQALTREDEQAVGREEHPRILRQFGGAYEDAALASYVASVGQSLALVSELPEQQFTFTVLNSPIVNAFALPGGYVYVTRGLLALAGSEAELAGVLAHEIGHVTARHATHRLQQAQRLALDAQAGAGAGGVGGAGVGDVGRDATAYVQGYSREQELEADTLGIRYLARAGYDPAAMASFLARLDQHAKLEAALMGLPADQADQMNFVSTHPRTADRVQAAAQRAGEVATSAPVQRGVNPEAYLRRVDGILYGDDPEQGFVRGTAFLHPKLLFRFDVPSGFRLFNSTQRVIARNPQEAIILFDSARLSDAGAARTGQQPAQPAGTGMGMGMGLGIQEYLTQAWSRDLALTDVETIAIGGLPAATGWARVDTNRGARDLRLVAILFDADTIYRFTYITPPALTQSLSFDLRRSTYSFRALTAAEAAQLKPLRLKLVRVVAGDTVESLAQRLAPQDSRDQRFRALNGLGPEDQVQPGQWVKLVVE
ncbi:MAG: M48 family metalloprotease [Alphaproteobacteria bacterium]|nr:M48 family metalloprotease [Alphaproteobacteria bacterium]